MQYNVEYKSMSLVEQGIWEIYNNKLEGAPHSDQDENNIWLCANGIILNKGSSITYYLFKDVIHKYKKKNRMGKLKGRFV